MSKRNRFAFIVVAVFAVPLVLPAAAALAQQASQQDLADCQQSGDLRRAIVGCTRIASDPAQPGADRGRAWHLVGNDEMAINALDDAIRAFGQASYLDSPNAAIYHASRAIAELRKGDRALAIADYRMAAMIDAAKLNGMLGTSAELKEIADAAASTPPRAGPRSWLGIGTIVIDSQIAKNLALESTKGALVAAVQDKSPALSAGIEIGDVILEFDGKDVVDPEALVDMFPAGKSVQILLLRKSQKLTKRLTLGTAPN